MKRITVITGHYGSGKSTFAANYAVHHARLGEKVSVVDMDTVNPYYRTADLGDVFEKENVKLIAPMYARTNLDVPILNYDISALYEEGRNLVIDMGGDDQGAYPLGRYADFLRSHAEETDIFYVVNFRRYLTHEAHEADEILHEIENACRLKVTGIINNTNLGNETDSDIIADGIARAEKAAEMMALPLLMNTYPQIPSCDDISRGQLFSDKSMFPMTVYIKNVWQ